MKDKIYSHPLKRKSQFVFDAKVARVFEDMIHRSVPGYRDIVQMAGVLAARCIRPRTQVYDLGCSLGAVSKVILESVRGRFYTLHAVDSSAAMIARAKKNLRSRSHAKVYTECLRLEDTPIQNASLIILNFVLQFIPKAKRLSILRRIYQGMVRDGVLIFSEKISFSNPRENDFQQKLHEKFKAMNGYSQLEISQKRSALEKVLIPEALYVHERRLKKAGFSKVYVWFRCFNFISLIAVK